MSDQVPEFDSVEFIYEADVFERGEKTIAECPGLNIHGIGKGREEALAEMKRNVHAFLEAGFNRGTLVENLAVCKVDWEIKGKVLKISQLARIGKAVPEMDAVAAV